MKKIITLLLVLTGMVCTASAQKQTANTIRFAFSDTNGQFTESNYRMYVFGSMNDDTWPGVDITENTEVIDGVTYYYRDFPTNTYGTSFSVIAINDNGTDNGRKQTVDLNWSYNGVSSNKIQKDTYYNIKSSTTGDGKYEAELIPMLYVANTDATKFVKASKSGNNYSATISVSDFGYFIIANSYAFTADGSINWSDNDGYPANIYRPNYDMPVSFSDVSYDTSSAGWAFNRYQNEGSWKTSDLASEVKIQIDFVIDEYNAVSCSLSPYFTRTIDGYATFSSEYAVAIPENVTAYYATAAEKGKVTMTSISDGIPANTGAFLKAEDDIYTFKPATTTSSESTNLLVPGTASGVTVSEAGAYHYVYAEQGGVSAFYNVASAIDADMTGKAYLETTMDIQPATGARVAIVFDDDVTGINSVNRETINNNEYYNLGGQRVAQPTKGLYIVNGKKVVIR